MLALARIITTFSCGIGICTSISHFNFANHWIIIALSYFGPYYFLLSFTISVYSFTRQKRILLLTSLTSLLLLTPSVTNLFSLSTVNKAAKNQHIKVASLNCNQLKNKRLKDLANEINQYNPDIICLQEIGVLENWQDKYSVLQTIQAAFQLPYGAFNSHKDNVYGLAILSKYPIEEFKELFLPITDMNGTVAYELKINDTLSVEIINCHLPSFNFNGPSNYNISEVIHLQKQQVALINEHKLDNKPQLIVGDFNFPAYGNLYKEMTFDLSDAFYHSHQLWGTTLQNKLFPWRIDGQYFNQKLACTNYQIVAKNFSDHNMLIGSYTLDL